MFVGRHDGKFTLVVEESPLVVGCLLCSQQTFAFGVNGVVGRLNQHVAGNVDESVRGAAFPVRHDMYAAAFGIDYVERANLAAVGVD